MPKKAAAPILKGLKKAATPLRKQIFKKWLPPVLPFTKGKQQSGFCFSKGDAWLEYVPGLIFVSDENIFWIVIRLIMALH